MNGRGVIFDLVAAQSPSYRGRGIARYGTELVRAIAHAQPDLVSAIVLHPGLPTPEGLDDLQEWLTTEPDWGKASVLHLSSVFELEVPVRTYWPREAAYHRLLTAVTLYDLIPDLFPGWYLEDPGLRRRWRCCREVVRAADAVLTPSESTKRDAVEVLGVPERRVTVIGSGTSPVFHPPKSREAAFRRARKGVAGLQEGFVIYNGAFAPAKNVDRLVQGYAGLPPELVERHQLVIVCEAAPLTRNHYLVMAREMGLEGRVLVPGFVPEDVLVSLHQSAALGVFPSLYEGYGLPVIESMACGTPNIAADNSSLREILPREARFRGEDPAAIGEAIAHALRDGPFRQQLIDLARKPAPSWAQVAARAAAALGEMAARPGRLRPRWRKEPALALVGAPQELALATAPLAMVDLFGNPGEEPVGPTGARLALSAPADSRPPALPAGAEPFPFQALNRLDAWRGGYDAVVGWTGEPDGEGRVRMEKLAALAPGRCIALVRAETVSAGKAMVSALGEVGAKVISLPAGADWEESARLLVSAVRGTAG